MNECTSRSYVMYVPKLAENAGVNDAEINKRCDYERSELHLDIFFSGGKLGKGFGLILLVFVETAEIVLLSRLRFQLDIQPRLM